MDETTSNGNNINWWNTTASITAGTNNLTFNTDSFAFTVNGTSWHPIIPDKNWMPYSYVEYEPKWHKKFASYKKSNGKDVGLKIPLI